MKILITESQLKNLSKELTERKNVGVIYHFTSYEGMIAIINDNMKLKNMFGEVNDKYRYISFTRDKRLVSDTIYNDVRITVDGTKLSDKYQIRPYADTSSGYGRTKHDEKEERALVKPKDGFVDIYNSLMVIDIKSFKTRMDYDDEFEDEKAPPSYLKYMELIDTIKKTNLPYKIVDKF